MADAKTETPVTPAAPKTPVDMAKEAQVQVAQTKTGRDLLRPFRYAALFISGTLNDTAEYALRYGRKATRWGIALGILAAIATGGMSALVYCAGAGLVGGFTLGLAKGLATGGIEAVNRQRRIDRYGDDLDDRAKIQQAAKASTPQKRRTSTIEERRARENDQIVPQQFARDKEFAEDYQKYWASHDKHRSWQDRVSASTSYDKGMV